MPKQELSFIEQLYQAIENERSAIVDWDPNGKGFIVGNLTQFTNKILLRQFNIGRLDSFARKLNRHGFKRSKIDKTRIRFYHKYFNRDSKNLLEIKKLSKQQSLPKHIKLKLKREQINNKSTTPAIPSNDIVNDIYESTKNQLYSFSDKDKQREKCAHGKQSRKIGREDCMKNQNQNQNQNQQPTLASLENQDQRYCGSKYLTVAGLYPDDGICESILDESENLNENEEKVLKFKKRRNRKNAKNTDKFQQDQVKIEEIFCAPKQIKYEEKSENSQEELEKDEQEQKNIRHFLQNSDEYQA